MLLQTRGGVLVIFPATPDCWRDLAFRDLLAEGGWRVSAERRGGSTTRVEILSSAGGTLRLQSPWPSLAMNGRRIVASACGVVDVTANPGDLLAFSPAACCEYIRARLAGKTGKGGDKNEDERTRQQPRRVGTRGEDCRRQRQRPCHAARDVATALCSPAALAAVSQRVPLPTPAPD